MVAQPPEERRHDVLGNSDSAWTSAFSASPGRLSERRLLRVTCRNQRRIVDQLK
jgi:hypothetical protein